MSEFINVYETICNEKDLPVEERTISKRPSKAEKMLRITDYLAADRYPLSVYDRDVHLISFKLNGKVYFPITFKLDTTWLKWLKRRPCHHLHDPKTDLSYNLYE